MNTILSICFRFFKCTNKTEELHYAATSLYYMVKFDQEILFNMKIANEEKAWFLYSPEDYLKPFNTPHLFPDMFNLLYLDGEMLTRLMIIPDSRKVQRRIHIEMLDRQNEDLYKLESPAFTKTEEFYRTLELFLRENVSF